MHFFGALIIGVAGFILGFAAMFGVFLFIVDGFDLAVSRHGQLQYMLYAFGGITAMVAMARARMIR